MKIWENIIGMGVRNETFISKIHFGCISGKSIVVPIFCIRQTVAKYRKKKRKLCMVFVYLEKEFDNNDSMT